MSGVILGPRGEKIDLTHDLGGFTPEQLKFIANNAPRLGDLPADATEQSRSQRQVIALQQGLFKMSQDNFQLWTLVAAMYDSLRKATNVETVAFTQLHLAGFANPKTWPSVDVRESDGNIEIKEKKHPEFEEKSNG